MRCIRFRHPALQRGRASVLAAGDLEFPAGSTIGVVGANGAGKTTLLMALAGVLARCRAAPFAIDGTSGTAVEVHTVGYSSQAPALPQWLTVKNAVRLLGHGEAVATTVPGLLIDELPDTRVRRLSGGHRLALAVALAVASGAPLLVLDEPFAALDLRRRRGLLDDLRRLSRREVPPTVFVSSQVGADLDALCSHFVILARGRYAFTGSRDELVGAGATRSGSNSVDALERSILAVVARTESPALVPGSQAP